MKTICVQILQELKKILRDSLSESEGPGIYSAKRLTMFASFNVCVVFAIIDMFTKFKVNEIIFDSFLLMASGQSVLSLIDKKVRGKQDASVEQINKQSNS